MYSHLSTEKSVQNALFIGFYVSKSPRVLKKHPFLTLLSQISFTFVSFYVLLHPEMIHSDNIYWYGISAATYIVTCWIFIVVRWFHTCRAPKDQHSYIWPDRKLQVIIYSMSFLLLPYVLNPASERAWTMWKIYFPVTYYFYCGVLLFCFFGSVKQWNTWKTASWIAAFIATIVMAPFILDAWIPGGMMKPEVVRLWTMVATVTSIGMMCYSILAMWQVGHWMREARDENYSNPDDFPTDYAGNVWHMPVILTPIIWPAFLFDSQDLMAILNIFHSIFNMVLLLIVLPPWRRAEFGIEAEPDEQEENDWHDEQAEERARKIAEEIEAYVNKGQGFLDPHLKMDNVVEHCSYSRTYVSHVFKTHFGGFSRYVNGLRLCYFDNYVAQHPSVTKDAAAQESGFSSYTAYYKAKDRLARDK